MAKKRGQGEWSYTQRKDGLWTARKQFGKKENGKANIKAFYGKNISEVKNKAKQYEFQISGGIREDIVNRMTIYDYVSNWLKTFKYNSVKNTTYDGLEYALEVRVKPYAIANVQLKNLSTEICQQYINELTNSDKKYTLATITKTYNMLNQCLTHAENVGDIQRNPMRYAKLPSSDKVQAKTKEIAILVPDEIKKVVAKAKECFKNDVPKYYYGDVIILMLFTGMRIGECLGLRWSDIDLINNTIKIDNTISTVINRDSDADGSSENKKRKTKMIDTSPKTKKSNRTIPINNTAREAILSIRNRTRTEMSPNSYVVVTKTGKLCNARNISRTFDAILTACGIDKNLYSPHSLRHTFVSMLLNKGVDMKIISELVGHEKVSTTYNIYAHLMPEQKENSVKLLDEQ